MPISGGELRKLQDAGKVVDLTPPAPENPFKVGTSGPELSSGEYLLTQARESLADFTGRVLEASRTAGAGENLNVAMLRLIAPRFIANWGSNLPEDVRKELTDPFNQPNSPENLREAVSVKGASRFEKQDDGSFRFVEAEAPGPWSGMFGAGVKSAFDPGSYLLGGPVGKTVGGTIAKNVGANFTAGAVAEEGAKAGGSLGEAIGGETGRKVGATIGALGGGMAGYTAGSMRATALDKTSEMAKNAKAIYKMRKEDGRSAFGAAVDAFAGMRDKTKEFAADEVMQRIHDVLQRNPNVTAKTIEEFDQIAKAHGIDPALYNLAQRTNDPTVAILARQAREMAPNPTLEGVAKRSEEALQGAVKNASQKAWENILPQEAKPFITTLKETWDNIQARRQALLGDFNNLFKQRLADLSDPRAKVETGKLGQLKVDQLNERMRAQGGQLYEEAFKLADEAGMPLDVTNIMKGQTDFLKTVKAEVGGATNVAPSYKAISDILTKKAGVGSLDQLIGGDTFPKLTLREAGDIIQKINKDIPMMGEGKAFAAAKLTEIKDQLHELINSTYSGNLAHVSEKFNEARTFWKQNVGEAFKEGMNRDLTREGRSGARAGIEAVDPANFFDRYITPPANTSQATSMQYFNKLFGGEEAGGLKGTVRNEEMYKRLGDHIEDAFRKRVYQEDRLLAKDPEFLPREHQAFMQENRAALDAVPGLAAKLDGIASKAQRIKGQIDLEATRLKDMVGGPIAAALAKGKGELSQDQVGAVMAHILSGPQPMSAFLEQSRIAGSADLKKSLIKELWARYSPWDQTTNAISGQKMMQLLNSGKAGGDVSAVQRLFEATFGKEQAAKHIKSLEEIAMLQDRALLTDPNYLRIKEGLGSTNIKEKYGNTPLGVINDIRQAAQGRVSPFYVFGSMISRYAGQKLQHAWQEAQYEAFFSPAQSNMIAEAYKAGLTGKPLNEKFIDALAAKMGDKAGAELKAAYKAKAEEQAAMADKAVKELGGKAADLAATGARKAKQSVSEYLATHAARGGATGLAQQAKERERGETGVPKP